MGNLKTRLNSQSSDESFKALFNTQGVVAEGQIKQLKLAELQPYPNQPFRPYAEERLRELAEDIRQNGVLCPIIVRTIALGTAQPYQILAGHNRVNASRLAGCTDIPAIVKDVDDDEAKLILVNTNLNQREKLLPSEKAFAYKMQLEALKRQAGQPKKNYSQVGNNSFAGTSSGELAQQTGESKNQIFRYIRLTYLIPPLLEMVDNEALAFMVGCYLSYLPEEKQLLLHNFMDANELKKISMAQAEVIKERKESLDGKMLQLIFYGDPAREKHKTVACKLPVESIQRYFPDLKPAAIEKELVRILDFYFSKGN